MKKLFMLLILSVFALSGFQCVDQERSDAKLQVDQERLMKEANAQSGMPAVVNFTERKFMRTVIEKRDQVELICHAYLFSEMTGKFIYLGKCIGYGLPYATQYTNPTKTVNSGQYGIEQLPQADPNGLFMPASAEATWLMMIDDETGDQKIVYIEPKLFVSPFKLREALVLGGY